MPNWGAIARNTAKKARARLGLPPRDHWPFLPVYAHWLELRWRVRLRRAPVLTPEQFTARVPVGDRSVLLYGVLLGGSTHDAVDEQVLALVESAAAAFRLVDITTAGGVVATASTAWGDQSDITSDTALTVVSFGDIPVTAFPNVAAWPNGDAGAVVGTLTVTSGNQSHQSQLQLVRAIHDPGPWWRLTHADQLD